MRVGACVMAWVDGEWKNMGYDFIGTLVSDGNDLVTQGSGKILPDDKLPMDSEYPSGHPQTVNQDESLWQLVDGNYSVEARRMIVPLLQEKQS